MLPINSAYHENFSRGTPDFPFDYHYIDQRHPRYVMPFHYHAAFELLTVKRGELDIRLNENGFHLSEGDCLMIQGGIVHGGQPSGQNTLYECLVFSFEQLLDLDRPPFAFLRRLTRGQIDLRQFYPRGEEADICGRIEALFETVRNDGGEWRGNIAIGQVLDLFGTLERQGDFRLYQSTMQNRYLKHMGKVSEMFRYIYDNYRHQITLEDLAQVTDLSPKYFCRFFRELTGKRPMEYLNGFRIECAASLLITSDESVNEIAYSCGFVDPCYFAKLFKRYKGYSPRDFRLSQRAGIATYDDDGK